jgi:hypothetical protein
MARKPRQWRLPDTITGQSAPFHVDGEIKRLTLQASWKAVNDAVAFGRRALQVALEDARENEGRRPSDQFDHWNRTAELAKDAYDALRKLIDHMGPSGLPTGIHLSTMRVPKAGVKGGGKVVALISPRKKSANVSFTRQDAKDEVKMLSDARDVLRTLTCHANERKRATSHTNKIAGRDYGKYAFVYRLAESWIFLTGKIPGRGRTPRTKPILAVRRCCID